MDFRLFGAKIAADYDRGADQYRRDDEIEARSENHLRLGGNLRRICRSFPKPVRVLDLGCGTGRFFHWLENVRLLVGTDLSAEMLKRAEQPVHADQVTAREVRLIRGNMYEMDFDAASFELIYTLGVFGYGAALTPELARKMHRWLAPGGRLYFDAIEKRELARSRRLGRWVKTVMRPVLPGAFKRHIAARERRAVPVFNHTRPEIERLMDAAGFGDFSLSSNACRSPLWRGIHVECCARKSEVHDGRGVGVEFELATTAAADGSRAA